ncbi:ribosomal protection-like ABC-F family protein [Enterococcus timonensis]|uniref:ribosomal protection-like ABC-F family protein n=1 Tax=Enterococcus timonensis TaxID=1852364 RepID=UPI0008D90B9A|nr:ABC-F type ribosomal protection protein [Enterococcus timonensis]
MTIEIKNLTFGYDSQGNLLFDQANVTIDESWKLALIGRNGRGKTTLLQLLLNNLPFAGTITHQLNFTYFPQTVADASQLTYQVLQDLGVFEDWQLEKELNLLKVDLECLWRPFEQLSGGEQTKVLLALLFLDEGDFPLIDEPTNHLDMASRQLVAEYLQKKRQGFILVSHDRSFVDQVTDHVLAIDKSQLSQYQGNFSTYEAQKARVDEFELAENQKLQGEIKRLQQTSREKANWSMSRESDNHGNPHVKGSGGTGHDGFTSAKAAKMMKRSKAIETRLGTSVTEKQKLLKNLEFVDELTMNYQANYHDILLTAENVQLFFPNTPPLFQQINFQLKKGERLALIAPNGSGKSSLIKALLDDFPGEISGTLSIIRPLKISYVRQNYEDNRGTLVDFADSRGLDYQIFLSNLKKLGMERNVFSNRIEEMSMGQRKKVEIAQSLAQPAEIYLWDEPLNYLDVFNQKQLTELILTSQPTMIIIEHEADFIEKIGAKKIELIP